MKKNLLLFALLLLSAGAVLGQVQYTVSVSAAEGGTAYIGDNPDLQQQPFSEGEPCTVNAQADSGYVFTNWTGNDTVVSTIPNYSFLVTGDVTYIAHFREIPTTYYTINIESSIGGNVSIDQDEAAEGTIITITITEHEGFELDTITVYNTNNHLQTVPVTDNRFTMPSCHVTVRAEFRQQSLEIAPPEPICSGEVLNPLKPSEYWAQDGVWQLSPTDDFVTESTVTYTNEALDGSYNLWYLRYHVQISDHDWNSNVVQITVNSLEGLVLEGNGSVGINHEVEYRIDIDGETDHGNYRFDWSISDGQAAAVVAGNSCKVTWKTAGPQHVSAVVTDCTVGCSEVLSMDVDVAACIDNIQEIVGKGHTEGGNTYTLVLVYPNLNGEEFEYRWLYSSDSSTYANLVEGTYDKQYYYKGGRLKDGYYKVRISNGGCHEETRPYRVGNGSQQLSFHPNPSPRGTEIAVMNESGGHALLSICSVDGRLLHTQTVADGQAHIGVSLPRGVYVAYLTDGQGHTTAGKIVIQ